MSADIDDRPPVTCAKCSASVHWLAVFPGTICLECYEASQAGRPVEEMWDEMMGTWRGGAIR